jgi:molybdopterin converting factor small subunit
MHVTVKLFIALAGGASRRVLDLELPTGSTIADLLARLAECEPEIHRRVAAGVDDGFIQILLDGRNVRFLDGEATRLSEASAVAFLPPVAGG